MGCNCSSRESSLTDLPCADYQELPECVGVGIKRTQAWTGTVTKTQLKSARSLFWLTRTTGTKLVWVYIRHAVEVQTDSSQAIIDAVGVFTVNGSLEHCRDSNGNTYRLPAYMINDPLTFADESMLEPTLLSLKLREGPADMPVTTWSNSLVSELKASFGLEETPLYLSGAPLDDERTLEFYGIQEGTILTVSAHETPA